MWDRAAEEIVRASMQHVRSLLPDGGEIIVHKNNSDGKGNSYGCHENYLLAREMPFGRMASQITPHFVTRQVFCGAGKVGCELPGRPADHVPYQLSQRADFFEEEIGLETTLKRPIVNTRDEPHADAQKYRRLHVIVGDANMSEVATYLKVGTTAIVLGHDRGRRTRRRMAARQPGRGDPPGEPRPDAAPDDHAARRQPGHRARDPVGSARAGPQVRAVPRSRLRRRRRRHRRARQVGDGARRPRSATRPRSPTGSTGWPSSVSSTGYAARHDIEPGSPKLKAIDLQYHDLRVDRCLALRAGLDTMVEPGRGRRRDDRSRRRRHRAYFRGRCLQKFPDDVVAANWDSLVFDIGRDPLRRVPMMEPLRGTADHVGTLIDQSETARELLDRLGQ